MHPNAFFEKSYKIILTKIQFGMVFDYMKRNTNNMGNRKATVAKAQGANATKNYFVNTYNVRTHTLIDSTPYDTKEDAEKAILEKVEMYNTAIAHLATPNTMHPYKEIEKGKWLAGNLLSLVQLGGDMMLHIKSVWEMQAISTCIELGTIEHEETIPSQGLILVAYFVQGLHKGTIAEKDAVIEDIVRRYYSDAETRATFDRRASLVVKAKTPWEIFSALLAA